MALLNGIGYLVFIPADQKTIETVWDEKEKAYVRVEYRQENNKPKRKVIGLVINIGS